MDPKELINDLKNNKVKKYDGSSSQNTTWGIVHIDKNGGAHIVPAFPDKF